MDDVIDRQDHERLVAAARTHARRQLLGIVIGVFLLLATTAGLGWALAARAQAAAPDVIAEMTTERRVAMEARFAARSDEAQALVVQTFSFLQQVWEKNEALHRIRTNVDGARQQLGLLTGEVNAAFDSPTQNLGALLDNGPTRARAVLDHLVAVARELQEFVPAVLGALQQATVTVQVEQTGSTLQSMLSSMGALLEPFLGTSAELHAQWKTLKLELLAWVDRVDADIEQASAQFSSEELSAEFLDRLLDRVIP